MDKIESLNHTKWDCKYHVVFIPKNRRKALYGQFRVHLGEVFRGLAQHKDSRIEGGALDGRSCAHDDLDTAEICGIECSGLPQGEKRDSLGQSVWRAQEELYRAKLLGAWVLCVDGRSR